MTLSDGTKGKASLRNLMDTYLPLRSVVLIVVFFGGMFYNGTKIVYTITSAWKENSDKIDGLEKSVASLSQKMDDTSRDRDRQMQAMGDHLSTVDDRLKSVEVRLTSVEGKQTNTGSALGRLECAIKPRGVDCTRAQP